MRNYEILKYWWLIMLVIFDFLYYYLIQYLTNQGNDISRITIKWEGVFFIFIISMVSIWCVKLVKARMNKMEIQSIPLKYLQILLLSFVLFITITASSQFLLEFALGQTRNLEYIIGNLIIYIFLHIIVGNAYIAFEYFKESTSLKQDLLLIEKAKYESELKVLQQQMNPHFLFNNLNTLASLIPQDKTKAINYTYAMSHIFRHVSKNAKKDIITLKEELDFLSNYMKLLNFRFGEAYKLVQYLSEKEIKNTLAIPLSLQVIIENVIKHNSGSRSNPLIIEVFIEEGYITVKNEIRLKSVSKNLESGIGLKNLNDRYLLVTGEHIIYNDESGDFVVKLPLIKSIEDDSINN